MRAQQNVLLAALFLPMISMSAQGQVLDRIEVGGRVGVNVSTTVGPDADGVVDKSTDRVTFSAGAVVLYPLHRYLAVHVELLYAEKGTDFAVNGRYDGTASLQYINVPLLAHASIPVDLLLNPYIIMGPEFGVLVRARGKEPDGTSGDISERISSTDFGLVVGVGLSYSLGAKGAIVSESRYSRGLTTLDASGEIDYYNRTFTFMLGYQCCASSRRHDSAN